MRSSASNRWARPVPSPALSVVRSLSPVLALALLTAGPAAPQPPAEAPSYEGTAEVVAVDAVVDLDAGPGRGAAPWLPGGRSARAPGSLEATVDDAPAPVVAVDGPGGELDRIVLYFDLSLSDDHQVTWAAQHLGDQARELVRRGPVEVVAATPTPVTTLEATRDPAAVEEALGRLGYLSDPSDDLVELRLSGPEGAGSAPSPRERELVRDRLDDFLLALVERSVPGDDREANGLRRAVFLSTGGFDLPGSEEEVTETGRALAAYGWRVVPVLAPERRGLRPGKRIGKWRFRGLGATREEDRDPERAEAYLELAQALQGQGELERAAKAAEDAAYHFYGDPRTADREAEALVLAAGLHQRLGDRQRARRALRKAGRIDPQALEGHPVLSALPRAPEEALTALAAPGGGATVRDGEALGRAVAGIAERAVVTVQAPVETVNGESDGLARLVLRPAGGGDQTAEGWIRLGTPAVVTEARARREG